MVQDDILRINRNIEDVLKKEYQFKNSYQGKYCDPKNIYGLRYIECTINGDTKHLFAFNLFDKTIMKELNSKI